MTRKRFVGVQIPPEAMPKEETAHFDTFAGGFDSRDAQEDLPDGTSPEMRDAEVSQQDRLIRAPGVTEIETLDHQPRQLLLHAGPNYSSELLLLSPPYLGVYRSSATDWTLYSEFGYGTYSIANFAGVALLSCGPKRLHFREARGPLGVVSEAPGGFAVGVFANRVLIGGTAAPGEDVDLMRVAWSDSSSDYRGWSIDDGAADQVLIGSSVSRADRIWAFAYLGFNTLAVICRHSIWIGQPTGDVFQPIDLQLRLADTGCSHPETIVTTEFGVLFLSDDGVRLFDGNAAPIVSDAINRQLLPTLETDTRYSASFDPSRKRYYLHTPVGTWVLDMLKRRWFRWCTAFRGSIYFPTQGAGSPLTWGDAVGTWGEQTQAWWELNIAELGTGKMHFIRGLKLGFEDASSSQAFDTALVPRWRSPRRLQDNQDRLLTHLGVRLTYEANAASQIEVQLPAEGSGDFEPVISANLPYGTNARTTRHYYIPLIHTGRGVGLGIRIVSGDPKLRKASLMYQDNGEQLGSVVDVELDDCEALAPDAPLETFVARIIVTPTTASITRLIGTVELTAVVLDNNGDVDTTSVITWNSDAASVCLAVSTGSRTALVTAGSSTGFANVTAVIGSPLVVSNPAAITVTDDYVVHTFTVGSGDFIVTAGGDVDYLLVAGGGSAGSTDGTGVGAGGGGGGEVVAGTLTTTVTTYPVEVGGGGPQQIADHTIGGGVFGVVPGANGVESTFAGKTAAGGGGGGGSDSTIGRKGRAGGSGGGGASANDFMPGPGAYDGGLSTAVDGLGTDGNAGSHSDTDPGGDGGGAAYSSSINGTLSVYGQGGTAGVDTAAGTDELGWGGNGNTGLDAQGGKGGDGILIIRYRESDGVVASGGTITRYSA